MKKLDNFVFVVRQPHIFNKLMIEKRKYYMSNAILNTFSEIISIFHSFVLLT